MTLVKVGKNHQRVNTGDILLTDYPYKTKNPTYVRVKVEGKVQTFGCQSGCMILTTVEGERDWLDAGWFYFLPTINIENAQDAREDALGIYAHGELLKKLELDILKIEGWDGSLGIHACTIKGQDDLCTLWVWHSQALPTVGRVLRKTPITAYRGLVTLNSDVEGMAYAKKCYNEKTSRMW